MFAITWAAKNVTRANSVRADPWRRGQEPDDLVLAVAIAAWQAERNLGDNGWRLILDGPMPARLSLDR